MASWSTKRKISYLTVIFSILFVLIFVPFIIFWYEAPTCFDGRKNGSETGIDCGGSCELLCSAETLNPIVLWERTFEVAPGAYSAVAYIENPNLNSEARDVAYTFRFYGKDNSLLLERTGRAFIPKNKIFAIFEGNIFSENEIARGTFEFSERPVWIRNDREVPEIVVRHKTLSGVEGTPRLDAALINTSLATLSNIRAVAIIYDNDGRAIGASETIIESLAKDQSKDIVYTWPEPFSTDISFCEKPVDVMLSIDRSGSMDDDGTDPPQPLTDVKDAAASFAGQLQGEDQAGLLSFGTRASSPVDQPLTDAFDVVIEAIRGISINHDGGQHTNIGEGISFAGEELFSPREREGSGKVIVLLTDGIATHPLEEGNPRFAEEFALFEAEKVKEKGAELYVIGLGSNVNAAFLERLASSPETYFSSATSGDLESIYDTIATAICKKEPVVIEIIPLIHPAIR